MNAFFTQLIRAGAALAAGFLASLLVHAGFHLSPDQMATVAAFIAGIVTPLYYQAVTWLEKRIPWIGHLLIVARPAPKPLPAPAPAKPATP